MAAREYMAKQPLIKSVVSGGPMTDRRHGERRKLIYWGYSPKIPMRRTLIDTRRIGDERRGKQMVYWTAYIEVDPGEELAVCHYPADDRRRKDSDG